MKCYVVGLFFSSKLDQIVLIRKNRPEWQKGLLNGIGGKVESNESSLDAMVREFKEETGVWTSPDRWEEVLSLIDTTHDSLVHFYKYRELDHPLDIHPLDVRTVTDEQVELVPIHDITLATQDIVPNLLWIIPLCLRKVHYRCFTVIESWGPLP